MVAVACGARSELELPDPRYCSESVASAEQSTLDLLLVIDSSRSMEFETALGPTKWSELSFAINAFLDEPSLEGTGVGLVFFPEVRPEVPDTCLTELACGEPDACRPQFICYPSLEVGCDTDARCAEQGFPNDTCERVGQCDESGGGCLVSDPEAFSCPLGETCTPSGVCTNASRCDTGAYRIDELAELPGAAITIASRLSARPLDGGTPTLAAVRGGIASARDRLAAFPDRKAVVVLATDGIPTQCDDDIDRFDLGPSRVENIVPEVAAAASDGIETFVIGVFDPDTIDDGRANLELVADAGGREAFIVDTQGDVGGEVLAALEQLEGDATRCVFNAPWTGGDRPGVVEVVVDGGERILPRVGSRDDCDGADAFYFETSPSSEVDSVRFRLCAEACRRGGSGFQLSIGCE